MRRKYLIVQIVIASFLAQLNPQTIKAETNMPEQPFTVTCYPFRQDISNQYGTADGVPSGAIDRILVIGSVVYAVSSSGIATWNGSHWEKVGSLPQTSEGSYQIGADGRSLTVTEVGSQIQTWPAPHGVRLLCAIKSGDGSVLVGASDGLYRYREGKATKVDNSPGLPVHALAEDRWGQTWVGTSKGLYLNAGKGWQLFEGRTAAPIRDVRCIAQGADGSVWIGGPEGAARLKRGSWRYYAGRRWLGDNDVHAIGVDPNGDAWIGTDTGVSNIQYRTMTLEQKAAHYEKITAERHNRRGYVASCVLNKPGDLSSFEYEATDNDGLWTSLYVAAESFRYAATKDPQAKELATKSMNAMLYLLKVTGMPGFMARAEVTKNEHCVGYDLTDPNWNHPSPLNPNVYWKDDTSSDEVDGHYFAWYVYYDLVADAKEKKEIQDACRAVTNNILDHDYQLIGPSGKRTTWGFWDPATLNHDPNHRSERGLNALEILSHLKVAIHICGDQKFKQAYRELIERYHYALNTIDQKILPPIGDDNHSDDELAAVAYYPLLMLEHDPQLRAIYLASARRTFRIVKPEHSPFHDFIYGAITGNSCDIESGLRWLQRAPWDLRTWTMTNSHRADITINKMASRSGAIQSTEALWPSESVIQKWNSNPYELDGGNDGRGEEDGAFYLLPYWLGRYADLFTEASR